MNNIEANNLKQKLEKYEELNVNLEKVTNIINYPKNVYQKYGSDSDVRISIEITHGNGSNNEKISIPINESVTFQNIITTLKDYTVTIKNKIDEL